MVEVRTVTVVHDVKHPEEVEEAPLFVAAFEHLPRDGRHVQVGLLRMIEDDLVHRHRPTSEFEGRFALQQGYRCYGGLWSKIRERRGRSLLLRDSQDDFAGRGIHGAQRLILGAKQFVNGVTKPLP